MAQLTETLLKARARKSDITEIKKLNMWAGSFTDVSILRTLPDLEIVSLGNSCLTSLADFQYLKNLQELYLRRNNIDNLNELCYLQGLPKLKKLLLVDNPIANNERYRSTVLRTLPQLEELDSTSVLPEDREEAKRKGLQLIHPDDYDLSPVNSCSPRRLSKLNESDEAVGDDNEYNEIRPTNNKFTPPASESYEQSHLPTSESDDGYSTFIKSPTIASQIRRNDKEGDADSVYSGNCVETNINTCDLPRQEATNHYDEDNAAISDRHTEDPHYHAYYDRPQYLPVAAPERNDRFVPQKSEDYQAYESKYCQWRQYVESLPHRFPLHRRAVRGNPNLLWPILDLIKELDRQSLWIIELEARRLLNEVDN